MADYTLKSTYALHLIDSQPLKIFGSTMHTTNDDSQSHKTYRLFDTCISSMVPLPEIPEWRGGGAPRITVRMVETGQLDLVGYATCHDWKRDGGPLICRSARRDTDYLLTFPERSQLSYRPAWRHQLSARPWHCRVLGPATAAKPGAAALPGTHRRAFAARQRGHLAQWQNRGVSGRVRPWQIHPGVLLPSDTGRN